MCICMCMYIFKYTYNQGGVTSAMGLCPLQTPPGGAGQFSGQRNQYFHENNHFGPPMPKARRPCFKGTHPESRTPVGSRMPPPLPPNRRQELPFKDAWVGATILPQARHPWARIGLGIVQHWAHPPSCTDSGVRRRWGHCGNIPVMTVLMGKWPSEGFLRLQRT